MADPKYANLPGIDLNSPDTYETSDLPEDDQTQILPEDSVNEDIDNLNVNVSEAYGKFKGKSLDSKSSDFSDRIGSDRRTGYDVPRTEYEMAGEGSGLPETPQQKYQRLQHEIRQLSEDINSIKENVKIDSASESMSPVITVKQTVCLQQQLDDLHLDKLLGGNGGVNLADPQGALQKRLISQLQSFQGSAGDGKSVGKVSAAAGDADKVSYQLHYRPEQAKFSNNARVADLEQRLERIEALLGNNTEKVSYLTADTSSKTLLEAVALLSAKSKLLEPSHLEQIEGRLHMLGQKLGQIAEKKDVVEQTEKQNKVTELYEIVKKWDSLANTLPHIVDRLTALKDLHEQALQFNQALSNLDTTQQQIQSHISEHGDMLKQVRQVLGENMSSMKANCEKLDSRLAGLKK